MSDKHYRNGAIALMVLVATLAVIMAWIGGPV